MAPYKLSCYYYYYYYYYDWKHPPGRPRRTWLQQVEEDIGLSVGADQIASPDRLMWRTLRPSAGQAQQ